MNLVDRLFNGNTSGGGGGGGIDDIPTFVADEDNVTATCNKTFAECKALCEGGDSDDYSYPCRVDDVNAQETLKSYKYMQYYSGKIFAEVSMEIYITYEADGTLTLNEKN